MLTDLISWWSMEEASGTRADSHTNGYDLTDLNSNIGSVTGKVGDAAYSDSFSGRILQGPTTAVAPELVFDDTTDWSISVWVYPVSSSTLTGIVLSTNDTNASLLGYEVRMQAGKPSLRTGTLATSNSLLSGDAVTVGNWVHIVVVFNAGTQLAELHQDGVSKGTSDVTVAGIGPGTRLYACGTTASFSSIDKAYIDEIGMWSKALSSDEIGELYNSGAGIAYPG